MFLGHYALGFAAKKLDNRISLGTTVMAAQFIDLLWPLFLILGIEEVKIEPGNTAITPLNFTHYPWSHSLPGAACWAVIFGIVYFIISRNRSGAILLAALVLSHWLLDFITHRPDLSLGFNETHKVGLGLWNNKAATFILESGSFLIGVIIYMRSTRATNRKGTLLAWSFILFLILIYIMSVIGPTPDSVNAIKYSALGQWLFIAWAYWVDRNRVKV